MDRDSAITRLKAHGAELRAMGVASLSLFGSTARGDERDGSDVDVAITLDRSQQIGLFAFAAISAQVQDWFDIPVDVVGEPARKARFQAEIDRDRIRVF